MLSERPARNELLPRSLSLDRRRHRIACGVCMVCSLDAGAAGEFLDLLLSRRLAAPPPAHSLRLGFPGSDGSCKPPAMARAVKRAVDSKILGMENIDGSPVFWAV